MIRFALRAAPLALMVVPLWVYRGHFGDLERADGWRTHTIEARSIAGRMARHAGCPPDPAALRLDFEEFAAKTSDNPRQVAVVAAIRPLLGRPEAGPRVAALALEAEAEEDRLLPIRTDDLKRGRAEIRVLADRLLALGVLASLLPEMGSLLVRLTRPPSRAALKGGGRP